MRSQVATTVGVSVSAPAVFDVMRNPFNVGIGVVVTGTATYTIQHTFDDIMNTLAANCTWFNHDDTSFVNATTNQDGNFAFSCTASRINQTAGAGSVTATYIQSGLMGGG